MDADDREREAVYPDAEADGDRRGGDLADELLPPVEAAEIVDRADDRRHGRAEEEAARLVREVEERERRDEDPEEERESAEPRHGLPVQPARLGPVDCAEPPGHAPDRGREHEDDPERDERSPDDLEMVAERLEHQRATSARTNRVRRSRKIPKTTATPMPARRA